MLKNEIPIILYYNVQIAHLTKIKYKKYDIRAPK